MIIDKIRILHIEDNPGDAFLLDEYIKSFDEKASISLVNVSDVPSGIKQLGKEDFDIIFLDLGLPGISGLDAVRLISEDYAHICLIVISGNENLDMAKSAIQAGAQDYLSKNELSAHSIEKSITFSLERFALNKRLELQTTELNQLSTAVAQSANMIVITNLEGEIEYVNDKFTEVTGYEKHEIIGKNPSILKSGKHSDEFYSHLWKTVKSGKTWRGKICNKKKNDTYYWENATISPVLDHTGNISNFVAIKEDITEAKNIQDRLEFTTEAAQVGTWEWGIIENIFRVNQVLKSFLSLSDSEKITKISHFHSFIHSDDFDLVYQALEDHLKGKTPKYEVVYRFQNAKGEIIWVYDSGKISETAPNGDPTKMSGVMINITTLKKQELDLEFERKQLIETQSLGSIGSLFYQLEEDTFKYVSPETRNILGWGPDEVVNQKLLLKTVIKEDRNSFREGLEQMSLGHSVSMNFRVKKGNEFRWIKLNSSPSYQTNGRLEGVLVLIQDVSDDYNHELRLEASEEKFRLQSEFLPHILWTTDESGMTNYINESGKNFYGEQVENFRKGTWKAIHPSDRKEARNKWLAAVKNKSSYFNLERHKNVNGEYKWLSIKANPIINESGNIDSWIGVSTNVDDEIKAKEVNEKLVLDLKERVKETTCLYRISHLAETGLDYVEDIFSKAVEIIKEGFVYPDYTEVRITSDSKTFKTGSFNYKNKISETIHFGNDEYGVLEVCLATKSEHGQRLDFLKEEYVLIESVSESLGLIINQLIGIKKLAASERRFSSLIENATTGICLIKNGRLVEVNKHLQEMLKFEEDELLGTHLADFSPEFQPDGTRSDKGLKPYISGAESGRVTKFKWNHLTKNGEIVICDVRLSRITFEDGDYVLTFLTDITEEQATQQALIESEKKYRSIFENINDGYLLLENTGEVLNINPAGLEILEVTSENILGEKLESYFDMSDDLTKLIDSKVKFREHFDIDLINGSGVKKRLEFNIQLVENEKEPFLIEATFRDITEHYRFNQYLNYSLKLYEAYKGTREEFIQSGIDFTVDLLNSKTGFFHLVDEDRNKIKLVQWSKGTKEVCQIPHLVSDYDIDKAGVWVDCIKTKKPVIHNDYKSIKNKGGLPKGHFSIVRDLEVPIIDKEKVVAIIGVGNKAAVYNDLDAELLTNFANLFYSLLNRKELEEEYLSTLETFEESLNIGEIGTWKVDHRYKDTWWSERLYDIYGLNPIKDTPPEGKSIYDFTHPDDREKHMDKYKKALKTGVFEHEFRIQLKTGEMRYLYSKCNIEFDSNGAPLKEVGLIQDITKLKEAQLLSQEKSQQFENIVSSIQGIVYKATFPEIKIEFISDFVKKMLGYSIEEIKEVGDRLLETVIHPDDIEVIKQDLNDMLKDSDSYSFIFRMLTKEGKTIWVNNRGKLVKGDDEKSILEGLIVDVSDSIRSEERVMNAFMEASDQERARISKEIHDSLQQTLTIASLNLEFVRMEKEKLSEKARSKFDISYDYLKRSLSDSRAIAHSLMPKAIEDFGFVSVVESMVEELNKIGKTEYEFISNIKDVRFKVPLDTSLYKIVQEASNNIMKHAEASNVTIQYMKLGDKVQLTIEDDGKGFNASHVKDKDSGFGLANMRNRVSSFGAEIFIDSYPEHGTTIFVEFPFKKELLYI